VRDSNCTTTGSSLLCGGNKSLPLAVDTFVLSTKEGDRSAAQQWIARPEQAYPQGRSLALGHSLIIK